MKGQEGYVQAFTEGYGGKENYHLLTSNMSDAHVLGMFFGHQMYDMPKEIKKSRGYTWIVDRKVYRVDGHVVTEAKIGQESFR
jgi:hypothetical protein